MIRRPFETSHRHPRCRPHRRSRLRVLAVVAGIVMVAAACSDDGSDDDTGQSDDEAQAGADESAEATAPPTPEVPLVFNGQGNNLDAYSSESPFDHQRVITNATEDPDAGLDINAQICFFTEDDTRFMIAGEDTDQDGAGAQGWGIFEVTGSTIGDLSATEVAKLTPTFAGDSNPENYGCGRLSDGRLVTSDIGNQAGGPATGQLIIWFPPFDSLDDVAYCKLDVEIGTAGQVLVGDDDSILVTSSLGRTDDRPSGVYRYATPFPSGPTAEEGCGGEDATGAPMAESVDRTLFIPTGNDLLFPAGIVPGPDGGYYVSSQANGVINQYDTGGAFIRTILTPPEGDELDADGYTNGSPQGLGIGPDGTLYYADIGLVAARGQDLLDIGPGEGTGSVRRITFDSSGGPGPPEVMADGLDYPDGIGVLAG